MGEGLLIEGKTSEKKTTEKASLCSNNDSKQLRIFRLLQ